MDLYGYSQGAASANEARNRVAEGNRAVSDFNTDLQTQKDTLVLQQKADTELREGSASSKQQAAGANTLTKLSLKGAAAAKTSKDAKAASIASDTFVPSKAGLFSRVPNPLSSVETVAGGGVESSADLARAAAPAAEVGAEGAEIASGFAKGAGAAAKGLGVLGGVATLGLEGYKIATSPTSFKDENWKQEVGQIGSIVGGGMQIAGALGAWIPGVGLGLELVGTGLAIGGSVLEDAGDTDAEEISNKKDLDDVDKEKRTTQVAQSSGVEVSRSE
tara:strand:+ start:767 stop:1591 length:825 start_codon:yes stop_codon:yes gene_type:complete